MTGGRAVVLGLVGRNFAAGMSGGLAFVLDQERMFHGRCNTEMVDIEPVSVEEDQIWLHDILEDFVLKTGSTLAQSLLDDWPESLQLFHKVHDQRDCHHCCFLRLRHERWRQEADLLIFWTRSQAVARIADRSASQQTLHRV